MVHGKNDINVKLLLIHHLFARLSVNLQYSKNPLLRNKFFSNQVDQFLVNGINF